MDTFIVKVDPSALAVELGLNRNTQPTNTGTSTQSSIAHGAKPTPNVPDDSSRQSRFRSETAKLDEAVNILQAGGVVAFPTETVYGLGANALDATAVSRIFTAKSRPSDNPLIVHVSSIAMLESLLPASAPSLPPIYAALVARFWPGPLTILVPRGDHVPNIITAGHATVAVRMPSHPVARALIERCGFPLAAPSANTSGRPSPTLAEHVYADLQSLIPLVVDGGACQSGVESTVVDGLRNVPAILRPGSVTFEQIRQIVGFENVTVYNKHFVDRGLENAPTTPGMKYRHYTPNADVVVVEMEDIDPKRGCTSSLGVSQQRLKVKQEVVHSLALYPEAVIGILRTGAPVEAVDICDGAIELHLGASAEDIARNLFKGLRDLELSRCRIIIIEGVLDSGHGLAVMNRIRKASSKLI